MGRFRPRSARPRRRRPPAGWAAGLALLAAACGTGGSGAASPSDTAGVTTTVTATTSASGTWPHADATALPLGDGHVTSTPEAGAVDSCQTDFPSTGGASVDGPWINEAAGTWDSLTKTTVSGSVEWPSARFSVTEQGDERVVTGNDLPVDHATGVFPIQPGTAAYVYDRNPNTIEPQTIDWQLPLQPEAAAQPSCLPGGAIGILDDGVVLFDALDGEGRDAAAHEVLDACGEHPQQQGELHHHEVPSCILDKATGPSTLVGYAIDGYGIYVERHPDGTLLTDGELDACHGRTSEVEWDGSEQDVYHYDVTLEYPYTLGCFHGTPLGRSAGAPAGTPTGGPGG